MFLYASLTVAIYAAVNDDESLDQSIESLQVKREKKRSKRYKVSLVAEFEGVNTLCSLISCRSSSVSF